MLTISWTSGEYKTGLCSENSCGEQVSLKGVQVSNGNNYEIKGIEIVEEVKTAYVKGMLERDASGSIKVEYNNEEEGI